MLVFLKLVIFAAFAVVAAIALGLGYVAFLGFYGLVGKITSSKAIRVPTAAAVTVLVFLGTTVAIRSHLETERQAERAALEQLKLSKAKHAERLEMDLQTAHSNARAYLMRQCAQRPAPYGRAIEPDAGIRISEPDKKKDQSEREQNDPTRPPKTPPWLHSNEALAASMVRGGVAYVEWKYQRIARVAWWDQHPEVRKRELARSSQPWPHSSKEEGIVGLEDIGPRAEYEVSQVDQTTEEDRRNGVLRVGYSVNRIDSTEKVAEYTALMIYGSVENRSLDELNLPVACSDAEGQYTTEGPRQNRPRWDPTAYFFKEVVFSGKHN
ncbi:MAG: hypothetical protein JNK17_14705 [Hydrogenophaga sp.]|nr:hypothetical protein [Hydrogenophaga sp.]